MAIEDLKSDLQSLIKLYRHLQSLKIDPQNAGSEYLDEKAQRFLKDLLDDASEGVFGAHSEIMAARSDVLETTSTIQLESIKGFPMSRPYVSLNSVETFPIVAQTVTNNSVTADDRKQENEKTETLVFSSEGSNPKPTKRKRLCRTPIRNCFEQLEVRDAKRDNDENGLSLPYQQWNESIPSYWDENQKQKNILNDPSDINNTRVLDDSVSIFGDEVAQSEVGKRIGEETGKKTQEAESISTSVPSTSGIIDSHISALEPYIAGKCGIKCAESSEAQNVWSRTDDMKSNPVNVSVWDFKDMVQVPQYDRVNNSIVGNEGVDQNTIRPRETKSLEINIKLSENVGEKKSTDRLKEDKVGNTEVKELPQISCSEDQVSDRWVKSMVQKIESMSRLSSLSDQITRHGCRYVRGIRVSESQSEKAFQDTYLRPQNEFNVVTSVSSMSNRAHQRSMVSPILYGKPEDQVEGRVQEKRKSMAIGKMILPSRLDVEDTSSSSVASSSWTTPQGITNESDSEEYSLSDMQSNNDKVSTSYPYSESDSFTSQTSGYENSHTSSGDTDVDLSEDINQKDVGRDEDSESFSVGSVTNHRPGNPIKVKKQTGKLKKLKDKLGLIFHHHHHHHHHHHNKNKATCGNSLWNEAAGKIFHGKGRTDKYKGKSAEKDVRPSVPKLLKKNQTAKFNDLFKGAWKHVRTSRSSKVSKSDVKSKKNHHGGKKRAQKLQWWRMLQQQRAVKKMPNKPKVKLGVGNNKPRLRSLPVLTSEDGDG